MPLDSCRAELSSSEELLEDGDVSRESSILGSPDARGRDQAGRMHRLGQGRGRSCFLAAPARDPSECTIARAPPSALSALGLLPPSLRPPGSKRSLSPPPSLADGARNGLLPALSNQQLPLPGEGSALQGRQPPARDNPKSPCPPHDSLT